MKAILFLLAVVLFPLVTSAEQTPFFEAAPDYYDSYGLNVASSDTIVQLFSPQNDFFSGIDFWLDNAGPTGTAMFDLLDERGRLLSSKTKTVPHIAPIQGGVRFHIDFGQFATAGNERFGVRITSAMPNLQLYYFDRIKLVLHNAPPTSQYIYGVAKIGDEEKDFSLKFALYESGEAIPPVLTNISAANISINEEQISFNANEPVDFKVDFGPSGQGYSQHTSYSGDYKFCSEGVDTCSLVIPVSPGTAYSYQLTARDSWGNDTVFLGYFETAEDPSQANTPTPIPTLTLQPSPSNENNTNPPIISDLRVTSVTDQSVDIAWATDKATDSRLLISYSTEMITIAAVTDGTFEFEHLLSIDNGLNPDTPYIATITSRDLSNNAASAAFRFVTLKRTVPTPTPTPSSSPSPSASPELTISPTPVNPSTTPAASPLNPEPPIIQASSDNGQSYTITWQAPQGTDPNASFRIDIISPGGILERRSILPPGSNTTEIKDLPNGNHTVIVYANENGAYKKIAVPSGFTTSKKSSLEIFLTYLPYLIAGIGVVVLGIILTLKFLKKKPIPAPPPPAV